MKSCVHKNCACSVWALSLCGGNSESGFEHNSTCAIFSISITLTENGMDHVFEVSHKFICCYVHFSTLAHLL